MNQSRGGGNSKNFNFHPGSLGKIPIFTSIYFKGVGSTTNWKLTPRNARIFPDISGISIARWFQLGITQPSFPRIFDWNSGGSRHNIYCHCCFQDLPLKILLKIDYIPIFQHGYGHERILNPLQAKHKEPVWKPSIQLFFVSKQYSHNDVSPTMQQGCLLICELHSFTSIPRNTHHFLGRHRGGMTIQPPHWLRLGLLCPLSCQLVEKWKMCALVFWRGRN